MVYSYNREFTLHLCDFSVRDPSLWKTDGKYRASLRMILCSNRPSLPDDNHPAESQPDPISRPVCAFSAVKPFKYVRQSFFFKSRAAVMNRNFSEQNRIRTDNRNRSVIPRAFHTVFKGCSVLPPPASPGRPERLRGMPSLHLHAPLSAPQSHAVP